MILICQSSCLCWCAPRTHKPRATFHTQPWTLSGHPENAPRPERCLWCPLAAPEPGTLASSCSQAPPAHLPATEHTCPPLSTASSQKPPLRCHVSTGPQRSLRGLGPQLASASFSSKTSTRTSPSAPAGLSFPCVKCVSVEAGVRRVAEHGGPQARTQQHDSEPHPKAAPGSRSTAGATFSGTPPTSGSACRTHRGRGAGRGRLEHRPVSPWGLELIHRQTGSPMVGGPYELKEYPTESLCQGPWVCPTDTGHRTTPQQGSAESTTQEELRLLCPTATDLSKRGPGGAPPPTFCTGCISTVGTSSPIHDRALTFKLLSSIKGSSPCCGP